MTTCDDIFVNMMNIAVLPDDHPLGTSEKCRVGTGRVIPLKFNAPSRIRTPQQLFPAGSTERIANRFIHREDPSQILIYTDGACLDNGNTGAKGGCAFVFRPTIQGVPGCCSFALETVGPTGEKHRQTSNRAELRAAIGALKFRAWDGEGFKKVVIATDSVYVVNGITEWVRGWLRRDWHSSRGQPVKNKDLWQALLGEAERWSDRGVTLEFWRIPRQLNAEADKAAKDAAANKPAPGQQMKMLGFAV